MRILLSLVLTIFSIYTGWIVWNFGYTSVFEVSLREHPSTQVLIDLFIMGGIVLGIMILDNQRRGRSFIKVVPFLIITLLAGSIGPLLYFIIHTDLLKNTFSGVGSK